MALLGGVSRPAGPVVGAVVLGLLSELFLLQFRYVYMIVLGAVLILVVLGLPHGIMGWRSQERTEELVRRWRWALARRIPRRFAMRRQHQLFVNGEWQDAPGGRTFPDVNPATGETFTRIPAADAETARRAVEAAERARGEWGELQPAVRAGLVLKAAQIWERRSEDLQRHPHHRDRRGAGQGGIRGRLLHRADPPGRRAHVPGERRGGALQRVRQDQLLRAQAGRRRVRRLAVELSLHPHAPRRRAGAGAGQRRGAQALRGDAAGRRVDGGRGLRGGRDSARRPQRDHLRARRVEAVGDVMVTHPPWAW